GGGGGGDGAGDATGGGDGASGGDGAGGGGETAPLTRAECERAIDHFLAVGVEEQRQLKGADFTPTEQQVAELRALLLEEQMESCLTWPRPVWECTLAATSVQAFYVCGGGEPSHAAGQPAAK